MKIEAALAAALGDVADGALAIASREAPADRRTALDTAGPPIDDLRDAAEFALIATEELLRAIGAEGDLPDPAAIDDLGDESLVDAIAGPAGGETIGVQGLALFGRFYCLHHPRLAPVVRAASPALARPELARLGQILADEGIDPTVETSRLVKPAVRSNALAAAIADWGVRKRSIDALRESHPAALAETLLVALAGGAAGPLVSGAARLSEAIEILDASLGDRPEAAAAAAEQALAGCRRPPIHLVVRARVLLAVVCARAGRIEAADEYLAALVGVAGPAELDAGAALFRRRFAGEVDPEVDEAASAGQAFEALRAELARIGPVREAGVGGPVTTGTVHRAVVEAREGQDLVVSVRKSDGGSIRGRLGPADWQWPDGATEKHPPARPGDSIVVEIVEAAAGDDGEARVAAVDPWQRFLPEFFRSHQDRILRGRVVEVEDERLVLSVIDRLVGEPDGVLGELTVEAIDIESPFPLSLLFEVGDHLPVTVGEIDPEDGWLTFESPWIDRDPWEEGYVARMYRPGVVYRGTVIRVGSTGVSVLLEPGIVAHMPLSPRGRYALIVPVEVVVTGIADTTRVLSVQRKL